VNQEGRYVRVQKSGDNIDNAIHLRELQVFSAIGDTDGDGVLDCEDVCPMFE